MVAVFAVDYLTSSPVTEIDVYNALYAEVATGMLSDGIDNITVDATSLSAVESKDIHIFIISLFFLFLPKELRYNIMFNLLNAFK